MPLPPGNGGTTGTVLIDGFWRATWQVTRDRDTATLTLGHFTPPTAEERADLTAEGTRLLAFVAPQARHELRFVSVA